MRHVPALSGCPLGGGCAPTCSAREAAGPPTAYYALPLLALPSQSQQLLRTSLLKPPLNPRRQGVPGPAPAGVRLQRGRQGLPLPALVSEESACTRQGPPLAALEGACMLGAPASFEQPCALYSRPTGQWAAWHSAGVCAPPGGSHALPALLQSSSKAQQPALPLAAGWTRCVELPPGVKPGGMAGGGASCRGKEPASRARRWRHSCPVTSRGAPCCAILLLELWRPAPGARWVGSERGGLWREKKAGGRDGG